jgi:hypothetical protein
MRHLAVLFIHFISTLAQLLGPGGVRSLVAESFLLKHQLLILNRPRKSSCDGTFPVSLIYALIVSPAPLSNSRRSGS